MSVETEWEREHACSDFRQQDCVLPHILARVAKDAAVSYSFPQHHLSLVPYPAVGVHQFGEG